MTSQQRVTERKALNRGLLRAKFMQRDRIMADLAALDIEISALSRELADAEGVSFLRPEAVRRIVLDGEAVQEAAE